MFKSRDEVVHYPRGIDQPQKYENIVKMRFVGFEGSLPVGVNKSVNLGFGFNRTLKRFAKYIDSQFGITEVIITKNDLVDLDKANKKIYLNERSLKTLQTTFTAIYDRHRTEAQLLIEELLYSFYKTKVTKPKSKYTKGTLAASLAAWGNAISEFSPADKAAIQDLFDKLSFTSDFLVDDLLAKTKAIVDSKYLRNL